MSPMHQRVVTIRRIGSEQVMVTNTLVAATYRNFGKVAATCILLLVTYTYFVGCLHKLEPSYSASTCSVVRPVAWTMDSDENRAAFKFLAIVRRSVSIPCSIPFLMPFSSP